jgi:hypothetical protein
MGPGRVEVKRVAVPELRLDRLPVCPQPGSAEKGRVEGCPHPHRRVLIARIGGALVKEACGCDITGAKESVTTGQEICDLSGGEGQWTLRYRLRSR